MNDTVKIPWLGGTIEYHQAPDLTITGPVFHFEGKTIHLKGKSQHQIQRSAEMAVREIAQKENRRHGKRI